MPLIRRNAVSLEAVGSVVAIAVVAVLGGGCAGGDQVSQPVPLFASEVPASLNATLGVFDRTKVLIAYTRSTIFAERLRAMRRERDEALAIGDTAWARELERRGAEDQERAHRQLAGRAPLTNVREALGDRLAALAHELGLTSIVACGQQSPGAQTIDVTDRIVAMFAPDPAFSEGKR